MTANRLPQCSGQSIFNVIIGDVKIRRSHTSHFSGQHA